MQYTGVTEMFGFVGELFNKGFTGPAKKFSKKVNYSGDNIVNFWTKSNRPIKLLGFMGGSFILVSGGAIINRKMRTSQIIPPVIENRNLHDPNAIYPRLQTGLSTAYRYALNGNIKLLDNELDAIAEIVIQYPEFKKFVKYKQPLQFSAGTYIDGHENKQIKNKKEIINDTENKEENETEESSETESIILKSQSMYKLIKFI